jgi:YfiH family protein
MSFYLEKQGRNIWQGKFSSFLHPGLVHGISTRFGGVSRKPYDTMNLALHTGDAAQDVWKNRQLFCASLGLCVERLCTPEQVHGEQIVRVLSSHAGRGSREYADALPHTDALITNERDLPLLLCFADCTPLLFYDPEHAAIGIAHGGWRGTVEKIGQKTVQAMHQQFGTRPQVCLAAIGPAIGPCCYEIGAEVVSCFRIAFGNRAEELLHEAEGGMHLDLWKANQVQLEEIGMPVSHIDRADTCTTCNSDLFFSYRADQGMTGRIGAVIALK